MHIDVSLEHNVMACWLSGTGNYEILPLGYFYSVEL